LSVAIQEFVVEFAKTVDLGGAHESEVLGPKEDDLPFTSIIVKRNILEGFALLQADDTLQFEIRKLVSYC
jgi:hypothetical protein